MLQQNQVFVLDTKKRVLAPCHPKAARKLLYAGKAAVYRRYPFTIILKYEVPDADPQPIKMKVDPGSKTTGIALVQENQSGDEVVWAGELTHRGQQIKNALEKRRAVRRSRRNRKTRYRKARFMNRARPKGWLPPSLKSRVDNIQSWFAKLYKLCNIESISMELVRFDMQLMQNAEISGVKYQQGELAGYEVREYLLEKWNRTCAYCGAKDTPLQIEHITPKARGGSNRVSNLTLACGPCNLKKGTQTAEEFGFPKIQAQAKKPLKDAAAVNATRWAVWRMFADTGLPVEVGTGGRTKYNRTGQGYGKAHWIDAACVGESGGNVLLDPDMVPLKIKAMGWQSRQMVSPNKYGFPRSKPKQGSKVHGIKTGDMVLAVVTTGKKIGMYTGRVAVRSTGSFKIQGVVDGISHRFMEVLHKGDGYAYE